MKIRTLAISCVVAGLACLASVVNAQTSTFAFNKSRSRLVVLLHGVTPRPYEDPDAMIATSGHARYYWGFNFIKALQGRSDESSMRVIQPRVFGSMAMRPNTMLEDWTPANSAPHSGDYAPICFPVSWFQSLPAGIETNQTLIKDYIRLMTKNAGANTTMVMVPFRDGSKHLMPQLGATIDQIYMSYQIAFGHLEEAQQPQIYLVGHSFGGIMARGIIANPTGTDLYGNKLTSVQRTRAEFLRNRVVLANTLCSPHNGTFLPDFTGDAVDFINLNGPSFFTAYNSFIAALPWNGYSQDWVRNETSKTMDDILKAMSGKRDGLDEVFRMNEYNSGILHPSTARRASGEYVPVFTMAGRNPGGMVYDASRSTFILGGVQYNPISSLDVAMSGQRYATEAMALHLIDGALHLKGYGKEGKRPWGTAHLADGDKVASPFAGIGPSTAKTVASGLTLSTSDVTTLGSFFLEGQPYRMFQSDGEYDSDGFLGWDSAHALGISANNYYRVFNAAKYGSYLPWDIDNHGSIMFNAGTAAWIHNELIREAGPFVTTVGARRSSWSTSDTPVTPSKNIKVEVLEVHDWANDLDTFSQADFTLKVRAGGMEQTLNLADDRRTVTGIPAFYLNNYPSTVIPIKIDVKERDTPDPDDLCLASSFRARSSIYLYFDTRTNRILGDTNAAAGDTLYFFPTLLNLDNKVMLKVRITQQ